MHTLIRDRDITTPDFVFYSDRLIRLVSLYLFTSYSWIMNNGRPFMVCQNSVLLLCDVGKNVMKVVEHGLGHLPFTEKQVVTPTGTLRRDIPHNHKAITYTIWWLI